MSDNRLPCGVCGRRFNPESLGKHERICSKTSNKKPRRAFDSSKQRAAGTDIMTMPKSRSMGGGLSRGGGGGGAFAGGGGFGGGGFGAAPPFRGGGGNKAAFAMGGSSSAGAGSGPPKSNWRKQHEEFIAAVRNAKAYKHARETGGPLPPPPPPSENPDYITCPTCGRRFNETAAKRHMEFCREQSQRVPATKRVPDAAANRRADARSKYAQVGKPKSGAPHRMGGGMLGDDEDYSGAYGGGGGGGGRLGATGYGGAEPPAYSSHKSAMSRSQGPKQTSYTPSRYASNDSPPVLASGRSPAAQYLGQTSVSGNALGALPARGPAPHRGSGFVATPPGGHNRSTPPGAGGGSTVFCHECGTKYATQTAKFCVDCGCRRLGLA